MQYLKAKEYAFTRMAFKNPMDEIRSAMNVSPMDAYNTEAYLARVPDFPTIERRDPAKETAEWMAIVLRQHVGEQGQGLVTSSETV